jgi:hypothetical protein
VNGLVDGAFRAVGPQGVQLLIDYDKHIIGCILSAYNGRQRYPSNLTRAQVAALERLRLGMTRATVAALGLVRYIASKLPEEVVENKVTPEWLLKKGRERFPEVVQVIEANGDRGRAWLKKQCEEIVGFCTGRLVWSDEHDGLVEVGEVRARG